MSLDSILKLTERRKASLRQPRELFSFSIDTNNAIHDDNRSLNYYYFPDSTFEKSSGETSLTDLNLGFKEFIEKDESKPMHLDQLLKSIIVYEKSTNQKVKADIITFRGIMTKLLCLPYTKNEDIDLNIIVFDEHIFIEEDHELKKSKERPMNDRDKLMCYWGYKFEALTTLNKPWAQASRDEINKRGDDVVNNIEQYISVVRTGIGSVKTILGGEVDCVQDYKPDSNSGEDPLPHYMELKTTKVIRDDKDARNFERKLLKSWAQSFLLGVRKIIYGFRDDEGMLKSTEDYDTESIPAIIKSSDITNPKNKWNGMDAISFYAAVLEWIKNTVSSEPDKAWRLQYKTSQDFVKLYEVEDPQEHSKIKNFLLKDFVDWRNSQKG